MARIKRIKRRSGALLDANIQPNQAVSLVRPQSLSSTGIDENLPGFGPAVTFYDKLSVFWSAPIGSPRDRP